MNRYHLLGFISFEGSIYAEFPEVAYAATHPHLLNGIQSVESSGFLERIREPELSVTRWI